jgi:four helix bundle protein
MRTLQPGPPPSRSYRDLIVWQKSVDLAELVYRLTDVFPNTARFGLTEQIRRAVVSVASNIAEGQKRRSVRECRHFIAIAHGSLAELDTQLEIAVRIGYLQREAMAAVAGLLDHIGRMLTRLRESLSQR